MPNRILREGILTSPKLARLGWAEEVFYRRLMSVVDDFGRYYADAGMLRAACYPRQLSKVSDSDLEKWLTVCVEAALVRVYPAEDGERYLELTNFGQQVRAKKSKFPDPPPYCVASATHLHSKRTAGADPPLSNEHLDVSVSVSVSEGGNARAREPAVAGSEPASEPATLAGRACLALKAAGVQGVNPSHPQLAELLSTGVTPKQLGDLAQELAEARGGAPKFAYVLATMAGRLRDAAAASAGPRPLNGTTLPYPPEFVGWERDDRKMIGLCRSLGYGDGPPGYNSEQLREYLRGKLGQRAREAA